MATFKALLLTRVEGGLKLVASDLTDADLMAGDVEVAITHSTVNYNDG